MESCRQARLCSVPHPSHAVGPRLRYADDAPRGNRWRTSLLSSWLVVLASAWRPASKSVESWFSRVLTASTRNGVSCAVFSGTSAEAFPREVEADDVEVGGVLWSLRGTDG